MRARPDPVGVTAVPPRWPTICQSEPATTTWTAPAEPRALVEAVRGRTRRFSRASSSRIAPWGGERPTGSSSRTGSPTASAPNRRPAQGRASRTGAAACRAGDDDRAGARSPTCDTRTPESSASSRADPHHQPATSRASATRAIRSADPRQAQRRPRPRPRERPPGPTSSTAPRSTPRDQGRPRPRGRTGTRTGGGVHGTTSPRSCSTRVGPIPGTSSSSSTERNARGSPVIEDLRRRRRADAGKRVELLGGRRAELNRSCRHAGHREALAGGDRPREHRGDEYLLAVGDGCGQIQAGRVGLARDAARPGDRVGDARTGAQPVQTRPPHGADDVHDEFRRRIRDAFGRPGIRGISGRSDDRRRRRAGGRSRPEHEASPRAARPRAASRREGHADGRARSVACRQSWQRTHRACVTRA